MPEGAKDNTFVNERQAILMAAGDLYLADNDLLAGRNIGHVAVTPVIAEGSPQALKEAQMHQARVNVAAQAIARLASLQDRRERGGVKGLVAAFEIGATKVMERPYLRDLGVVSDLVEEVRLSGTTLPTVE